MHLIFIRHAEPDYTSDSLTNQGRQEADVLAKRVENWPVTRVYCSPMGRAQATASPILHALHQEAVITPWLREFEDTLAGQPGGARRKAWDIPICDQHKNNAYFDAAGWVTAPGIEGSDIPTRYSQVCMAFDKLLEDYGYFRQGQGYRVREDKQATLLFICHMGVSCVILSHFMGVSPYTLWNGIYMAPASVTILNSELRISGYATFRCQTIGDASHLLNAGMQPSGSGYYRHPIFCG